MATVKATFSNGKIFEIKNSKAGYKFAYAAVCGLRTNGGFSRDRTAAQKAAEADCRKLAKLFPGTTWVPEVVEVITEE